MKFNKQKSSLKMLDNGASKEIAPKTSSNFIMPKQIRPFEVYGIDAFAHTIIKDTDAHESLYDICMDSNIDSANYMVENNIGYMTSTVSQEVMLSYRINFANQFKRYVEYNIGIVILNLIDMLRSQVIMTNKNDPENCSDRECEEILDILSKKGILAQWTYKTIGFLNSQISSINRLNDSEKMFARGFDDLYTGSNYSCDAKIVFGNAADTATLALYNDFCARVGSTVAGIYYSKLLYHVNEIFAVTHDMLINVFMTLEFNRWAYFFPLTNPSYRFNITDDRTGYMLESYNWPEEIHIPSDILMYLTDTNSITRV